MDKAEAREPFATQALTTEIDVLDLSNRFPSDILEPHPQPPGEKILLHDKS